MPALVTTIDVTTKLGGAATLDRGHARLEQQFWK